MWDNIKKHLGSLIGWIACVGILSLWVYSALFDRKPKEVATVYRAPTHDDSVCATALIDAGYIVVSPEEQEEYHEPLGDPRY